MREEIKGTYPLAVYDIKSGTSPVEGDMIAIDSSKDASPAADAAGLKVVGVAIRVNTDSVEVRDGVFAFANSGTHALDRDDRGTICYVEDKDTVSSDPGSHALVAGVVVDVYDEDVYVDMSPAAIAAATGKNPVAAVVAAPAALTASAPAALTASAPAALTAANPAAITYVAPNGGATQDAEARASLAQSAADVAAIRAEVVKLVTDIAAMRTPIAATVTDVAALRTPVAATVTDVAALRTPVAGTLTELKTAGLMASA